MPEQTGAALLAWFEQHKRDLPWRRTRDPYAIWVSEVMLQQTRVAAVLEHYARWMERFPTVCALAAAEEAEVLALWSGLGYYRRARMLHRAAKLVCFEHGGEPPRTAAVLRTLPGIGEYTAAAVASIAFGEAIAVVDGNVERVISRLNGLALPRVDELPELPEPPRAMGSSLDDERAKRDAPALAKAIRAGAQALLVPGRAADSNQSMMELGATVCLPKAPLCLHCPVQPWCQTRGEHVAAKRKPLTARAVAYALVQRAEDGAVLLRQRPAEAAQMAGMWELPETTATTNAPENVVLRVRHAITVTNYAVSILRVPAAEAARYSGTLQWAASESFALLPLTGLTRKVLRRLGLWLGSDGAKP